jgi:hypothetical protein
LLLENPQIVASGRPEGVDSRGGFQGLGVGLPGMISDGMHVEAAVPLVANLAPLTPAEHSCFAVLDNCRESLHDIRR